MQSESAGEDYPFRQLAQHLPTPCWISDAEGNITWVNDAWLAYTGKGPEDLAVEGLAVLHDPAVLPEVGRRWEKAKAGGVADEMTFPLRGRDGTLRPFLTRVVPLRDPAGRITRWFGTNTDVSDRAEAEERVRRSEAELRENEARLRLATEAAGVGVWEWRIASNEMVYSPQARAICGFGPAQPLSYEVVAAITHPEDFPRTSAQAARALDPAIRDREPYEYRIVRPSGEVRWLLARGEAVFEGEAATRYVGVLIDLTERKQAEDAIRESERQLQLALRAGRMAAWRIDGSGQLNSNPEMNALIGLPPESVPTLQQLAENYLPGELDRIRAAAAEARERGQRNFEIEYRYRRPDGEVRWYYARAEAQITDDGIADGIVGVVMDVTDRKADEEQLRFLAREVDHRANNLMSVVQGMVRLSTGEDAEHLRDVLIGRIQALARTHQLLAATRWEGADLRRLAEEELLPFTLGGARSRVRVEGPAVPLLPAAAQGVAMVLHELATNAAKHGSLSRPDGQVAVTWTIEGGDLALRWDESGGPPVVAPAREGFGVSVIDRALTGTAGGETRLDWRPSGVVCELRLPLAGRPAAAALRQDAAAR